MTFAPAPRANDDRVAGLGVPTEVTAPVREVVKVIPVIVKVQWFVTKKVADPTLFGFWVTEAGFAATAGLTGAVQDSAN